MLENYILWLTHSHTCRHFNHRQSTIARRVKVKQGAVKDPVLTHILAILSRTTCLASSNCSSYYTVSRSCHCAHAHTKKCHSVLLNIYTYSTLMKCHLPFTHFRLTLLPFIHSQPHIKPCTMCVCRAERREIKCENQIEKPNYKFFQLC